MSCFFAFFVLIVVVVVVVAVLEIDVYVSYVSVDHIIYRSGPMINRPANYIYPQIH